MKLNTLIRIICLVAIMQFKPGVTFSQTNQSVKEVAAAVESLRLAMTSADGTMLNKLASDSLSYGHSGGQVQNKAAFVQSITSGASVFVTVAFTDQTIKIIGNTALVRHILTASTNDKGKGPGSVKLAILLVWVKANNVWQMVARQAVKVP